MCPEVYFETCFIFVYFRKYTSRHMLGGKKSSISEIPEVLSTRPLQKITGGTLSLRSVRMFTHGKKNTAYLSSRCVFLDKSRVFVLFGCSKIMCVSSKRKISLIIRDNKKQEFFLKLSIRFKNGLIGEINGAYSQGFTKCLFRSALLINKLTIDFTCITNHKCANIFYYSHSQIHNIYVYYLLLKKKVYYLS